MKNPLGDSSDLSDVSAFAAVGRYAPPQPQPGPQLVEASAEAQEAEAAVAESGSGGPGSTVAVTASSGLTVNLEFDAAAMAAPASFRTAIEQAASLLSAAITDPITVNLSIDYSGTGGSAAGGPTGGYFEPYSTVRTDLVNNASPGDTTFNALPTGSSIAGQTSVAVWYSQAKLWGLMSPTGTEVDGSATFSTDINPNLLVGVALHELTHAMGRVPYGPSSGDATTTQPDIFDFYRFTSPGNILIDGDATAPAAYFSLNNGVTKIADYGQTSDSSDFLNTGLAGQTDPFDEFYGGSTQQQLTSLDLKQLDALGFHLAINQQPVVIEAKGSTELVQVGNDYFLDPVAGGTGPELQYGGAVWVAGEWGAWAPIGAEKTATGYEVAFKLAGANTYTVWDTDLNGNITTDPIGTVAGNSTALEALESSFQQDLNGDGVIGIPAAASVTIESFGSTSLVQTGNDFFLDNIVSGIGPELKYGGAPWVSGEWGGWTPIGTETTATGYEVAFKLAGANLYTVWNTDSSGNIVSDTIGTVPGNSTALELLEPSFHQDINNDGTTGIPGATIIETSGSTSLVETGSNLFMYANSSGTGPELKYGGAAFVAGQWGGWTPIGAEATATGYEVAFKFAGSNLFTVWDTDQSGNITVDPIGTVPGNSTALESLEPSFQQDLNGDGVIGIPAGQSTSAVASAAVSQTAAVTVANSDSFVFGSARGASGAADSAGATEIHLNAFSSAPASPYAALFQNAPPAQPPAAFHWANNGHDTAPDPDNHESVAQINAHIADLHSGFLIH